MIKLVLRLAQEDGPLRRECIDHTQQGKHKPEFPIGDSESGTPLSASKLLNHMYIYIIVEFITMVSGSRLQYLT